MLTETLIDRRRQKPLRSPGSELREDILTETRVITQSGPIAAARALDVELVIGLSSFLALRQICCNLRTI